VIAAESHQPDVLVQMVRLGLGWTVLPFGTPAPGAAPVIVGPELVHRVLVLARRTGSIADPAADDLAKRLRTSAAPKGRARRTR
jgi:DNA-binding transcriptional LysR family regulator